MIKTEQGYRQTVRWLTTFEIELEQLKKTYLPHQPDKFKILATGTKEQIENFRKEIADYQRQFLRKAS